MICFVSELRQVADPRRVDRRDLAAYVKYCGSSGLHESVDVDAYHGKSVYYFRDQFVFFVDDSEMIADWTLRPQAMDKMMKWATDTARRDEQAARAAKRKTPA